MTTFIESKNDLNFSQKSKLNQDNSLNKKNTLSNRKLYMSKSNLPLISRIVKKINIIENNYFINEKIPKKKFNKISLNINCENDKNKIDTSKLSLTNIKNEINNLYINSKKIKTNKNENDISEISHSSKAHKKNLEMIKKMSEKVKEFRKNKILELSKKKKSPMERLNNIKKIFNNRGITPKQFEHRRLELLNENNKEKDLYRNKIYYYEIIYFGNCSKVIEKCLKRRKQWKKYENFHNFPKLLNLTNINNNSSLNLQYSYNNNGTNNENNPLLNFIWSHSSYNLDFSEFSKFRPAHIIKMTNHFEFHSEISNKLNLFLNMMQYCESQNLELFSFLPLTFPIKYDSPNFLNLKFSFIYIFNNIEKYLSDIPLKYKYRDLFKLNLNGRTGFKTSLFIHKSHYDGRNLWLVKAIDLNRGKCIQICDNINTIEKIIKHFYKGIRNRFFKSATEDLIDDEENENGISVNKIDSSWITKINKLSNNNNDNKHLLFKNIKKLNTSIFKETIKNKIKKYKENHSKNNSSKKKLKNIIKSPSAFLSSLKSNNETGRTENKLNIFKKTRNIKDKISLNPIIIKSPESNKNINNMSFNEQNITTYNSKYYTPSNKQLLNSEIKTYQNNIMLIQKYIEKPLCYKNRKCDMRLWVLLTWDFNLYLFKEGHFKASSLEYDVKSLDNFVHLTNYSVQKYCEKFSKFEKSNEISFKDFEKSHENKINVKNDLIINAKEIIIHSIKSCINKINKLERKICFEIFGYDFIFDVNYKPFLLEINTNPGLEISSPLIDMLIHRMIDDAFKLTIDKVFILNENTINEMKKNPFKVNGYLDDENMWELLGNMS